jgi:hypothetical protein
VIADDLVSLMTLIVTCPYWQDLLKYSGKGESADEMRRAAPLLESSQIGDEEEFADAREFLASELGISAPSNLVGALHRAVSMPIDLRFHGQPATSLFGRFTIDDNPFFRMRSD